MGLKAVANPAAGGQPGSFTTLTVSGAATIGGGLAVTGNLALEAGGVISSLSSDGSTQTAVSQTNAGTTDLVSYKGVGGGSFRFISGDAGGNTVVGSWATGLLAVTGSISATGQGLFANGTAAAPSISFTNDPDCGLYRITDNLIGMSINGTRRFDFGDTYNASIGDFYIENSGFLNMAERTAPAAPAANGARIFAQDNGAGKTQLMVIFATGAAQQIAIEP